MNRFLMTIIALFVGAVMMQSFQCASRELTTAKVAMQNRDFNKAIDYAKKDIEKNPKSQEAYMVLAQSYYYTQNAPELVKAFRKAEEVVTDPKLLADLQSLENRVWVEAYNGGVEAYNTYAKTKNEKDLAAALGAFQVGSMVRPELPDFYSFMGQLLLDKGDTVNAMNEYRKAAQIYKAEGEAGSKLGIYMDMDRDQMITKLGAPKKVMGRSNPRGDSLVADYFVVDGKDLFVFSQREVNKNTFIIRGWRYDPNPKWAADERSSFASFELRPLAELADYEYQHKQYEEALTYLRQITQLQPTNSEVNSYMVTIYNESGRTDEALSYVKALIDKDPKNKYYLAQYGDILMSTKDYDQAISYYERALALDPNFDFVLRNIASAYKNKASVIQMEQAKKMDADKTYTGNTAEYFPFLTKSAEYFTRSLQTERFKGDLTVLGELFNIYLVLDRKDDLRKVAGELEAMESTLPESRKGEYYLTMVKVYSAMKDTEKLNRIKEKIGQ